jgi:excisionase family DNA binding protein
MTCTTFDDAQSWSMMGVHGRSRPLSRGMIMPEKTRFFTTGEIAQLLRVRRKTVDSYRQKGLLPATRIGHQYLFDATAVEQAIARSTQQDNGGTCRA